MNEELTNIEADELIDQIAALNAKIKSAEDERDAFISNYETKIQRAREICDKATVTARQEIEFLTDVLRRYAAANLPEGRKSIALPSGTLSFCKRHPKFFIHGQEANSKSKALLDFTKNHAPEFLKIKTEEFVDWSKLKSKLTGDTDGVYFADTGELIEGLQMMTYPDTFKVQMN